jgi:hypothetical protein
MHVRIYIYRKHIGVVDQGLGGNGGHTVTHGGVADQVNTTKFTSFLQQIVVVQIDLVLHDCPRDITLRFWHSRDKSTRVGTQGEKERGWLYKARGEELRAEKKHAR